MPLNQASRLKLRQNAVDGGKADFLAGIEEGFIDILRSQMLRLMGLQYVQDLHAWQRNFQARLL